MKINYEFIVYIRFTYLSFLKLYVNSTYLKTIKIGEIFIKCEQFSNAVFAIQFLVHLH